MPTATTDSRTSAAPVPSHTVYCQLQDEDANEWILCCSKVSTHHDNQSIKTHYIVPYQYITNKSEAQTNENKKSELMLMRRATASVSFRTQVVLVYLQYRYISAKIHSKCALQHKIGKKWLKTHNFGVQGRSRSSMLVPPESSSAVLVMISRKSVSICNHSRARLVDSSRNRTFSRGYPNLMRSYGGLLEPRGSNLTPLKSTFNAEHFVCRLS